MASFYKWTALFGISYEIAKWSWSKPSAQGKVTILSSNESGSELPSDQDRNKTQLHDSHC